jgi:hypothetical protein
VLLPSIDAFSLTCDSSSEEEGNPGVGGFSIPLPFILPLFQPPSFTRSARPDPVPVSITPIIFSLNDALIVHSYRQFLIQTDFRPPGADLLESYRAIFSSFFEDNRVICISLYREVSKCTHIQYSQKDRSLPWTIRYF